MVFKEAFVFSTKNFSWLEAYRAKFKPNKEIILKSGLKQIITTHDYLSMLIYWNTSLCSDSLCPN